MLLFHRGDVNRSHAQAALSRELSPNQLALIELHEAEHIQSAPPGVSLEKLADEPDIVFRHMFPHYQHMCAFWFRHIYLQSRLRLGGVKYYMRYELSNQKNSKPNGN